VHSNTLAVLGGAFWAHHRHIPHLWHVHEIIEHPWILTHAFPWLVSAMADHVVCNSQATYLWMHAVKARLAKKMTVIRNGVEAPTCSADVENGDLKRKLRPGGARLAIGLVGRINRLKGQSLLMDAVDLLHKQGVSDFSVAFIGSHPPGQEIFQTQLEQRIARSPLRDHIVLLGFTPDVWPSYAALDIVCVPSTEPESFGLTAAEAMAMGKPVVASGLGALTDLVVDGVTGLIFKPNDPQALASALEKLLKNDVMRINMGNAGKNRIDSEFTVSRMTEHFMMTYAEMVGSK
jgi:glycosyltransferase involved in cell wall biosynthesis